MRARRAFTFEAAINLPIRPVRHSPCLRLARELKFFSLERGMRRSISPGQTPKRRSSDIPSRKTMISKPKGKHALNRVNRAFSLSFDGNCSALLATRCDLRVDFDFTFDRDYERRFDPFRWAVSAFPLYFILSSLPSFHPQCECDSGHSAAAAIGPNISVTRSDGREWEGISLSMQLGCSSLAFNRIE